MLFDKIKAICSEKNISISSLERQAGLGNGTIDGWNESNPRLDSIIAVSKVLEIPIDELIKDEVSK